MLLCEVFWGVKVWDVTGGADVFFYLEEIARSLVTQCAFVDADVNRRPLQQVSPTVVSQPRSLSDKVSGPNPAIPSPELRVKECSLR